MKSTRILGIVIIIVLLAFNEWAFRFIFPLEPIDSFLRLMTLVLDGFAVVLVLTLLAKRSFLSERLGGLIKNHPKKLMLYIGLFLGYCLVMTIEFGCRFYFKQVYEAPYTEHTDWDPSPNILDTLLGFKLPVETAIKHRYEVNDSLIYDLQYHTDEFGRRRTASSGSYSSYDRFAMVSGCSFAFGYGLEDDQTLSYYLDSLLSYHGYNYGVSGYGTQQTLALLQSRNLKKEIEEPNGVLIHLFIDDHIPRLIGSRRLMKLWGRNFPYYYLDDGNLVREGAFSTGRHLLSRLYRAISESAFIDLFDIDIPWYISNDHLKLFGAVLNASRNEFLEQYPDGRFLVIIGPNSKLAPRVVETLGSNNIEFLDCSQLLDRQEKEYKIHWTEAHPNKRYYLELAQTIKTYFEGAQQN